MASFYLVVVHSNTCSYLLTQINPGCNVSKYLQLINIIQQKCASYKNLSKFHDLYSVYFLPKLAFFEFFTILENVTQKKTPVSQSIKFTIPQNLNGTVTV